MISISHYPEDGVTIISGPPEGDTVPMMRFIDPGLDEEYAAATAAFRKEAKARSKADPLAPRYSVRPAIRRCHAGTRKHVLSASRLAIAIKSVSENTGKRTNRAASHRTTAPSRCAWPRVVTLDFLMIYLQSCAVLALELHKHPERVAQSVLHLTVDMTTVDLLAYVRALMRGDTPPPGA